MATKISLKLLTDKTTHRVLFAEAGKDFVDFLFSLLAMPVSSIVKLLKKQAMVGCASTLYESVENLSDTYMQPNQDKSVLLQPKTASAFKLLLGNEAAPSPKSCTCSYGHRNVSTVVGTTCPSCGNRMMSETTSVVPTPSMAEASEADEKGGFVKGVVTYMITDDLVVTPMSTISGLSLFCKFNIKDFTVLEEKTVVLGMNEALKLLRAFMESRTTLTDVFLGKQASSEFLIQPNIQKRHKLHEEEHVASQLLEAMAEAKEGKNEIIHLEEKEGSLESTEDFVFRRIGAPVPLMPPDSNFDSESPPARALAVSDHFGIIFVAHSGGFCIAKIEEVVELANNLKETRGASFIQSVSILDASIGKVYLLALSADSSTLAASVGGTIHLFSVISLLKKEKQPFVSSSLGESEHVRDFQWKKDLASAYVVLSGQGVLYHGDLQNPLKDIMDNVDAVDWSVKGESIAIARKSTLSIMSSEFIEQFQMSLPFQTDGADANCMMKVDSIKWVRDDSIILGCIQLTDDGKEDGYQVLVITSKECGIVEASSNPVVLSFEFFSSVNESILPSARGPYLFVSYLELWELALAANRKNVDDHIVLLGWFLDGKRTEATAIDIMQDNWVPKIHLQDNGDENLIVGFGISSTSISEKFEIKIGTGDWKELSPYCILMCLTIDAKLNLFRFSRISETQVPPQEDSSDVLLSRSELSKSALGLEEPKVVVLDAKLSHSMKENKMNGNVELQKKSALQVSGPNQYSMPPTISDQTHSRETSKDLGTSQPASKNNDPSLPLTSNKELKIPDSFQNSEVDGRHNFLSSKQNLNLEQLHTKPTPKQGFVPASKDFSKTGIQKPTMAPTGIGESGGSLAKNLTSDKSATKNSNSAGFLNSKEAGKGFEMFGSSGFPSGSSGSQPSGNLLNSKDFVAKSSSFASSSGSIQGGPQSSNKISSSKDFSTTPMPSIFASGGPIQTSGKKDLSIGAGNAESLLAVHASSSSLQEGSLPGRSSNPKGEPKLDGRRSSGGLNSEVDFSKDFGSVKEMADELDNLLSSIEQDRGFMNGRPVFQKSSVLVLEEGLMSLSKRCRKWKMKMEERRQEIQNLQDVTTQVLARRIHIESIFKQVSNSQYWKLWNRQKLNPEFELKRQNILKLNQNLTNQLIELESHFNTLEVNKFGENEGISRGRRTLVSRLEPSRQMQYLHDLYTTLSSQLAVAEQHSEYLSKQMAALNIATPVKRRNVAKELFDSIGLIHDSDFFQSPNAKEAGYTPDSVKKLPYASSFSAKDYPERNPSSALKVSEPETARRRRDSLGRSWVFEPQKTTVKRMLQEERSKLSPSKSPFEKSSMIFNSRMMEEMGRAAPFLLPSVDKDQHQPGRHSANKDIQSNPLQQNPEPSPSFFKWSKYNAGQTETAAATVTSATPSSVARNKNKQTSGFSSKLSIAATGFGQPELSTIEPVTVAESRTTRHPETPISTQTSIISATILPSKTEVQKKQIAVKAQPVAFSNFKIEENLQTKPVTGSSGHGMATLEASPLVRESSNSSPLPSVSATPPLQTSVSAPTFTQPISLSAVSPKGSIFSTKPSEETNQTLLSPPSSSPPFAPSLFLSTKTPGFPSVPSPFQYPKPQASPSDKPTLQASPSPPKPQLPEFSARPEAAVSSPTSEISPGMEPRSQAALLSTPPTFNLFGATPNTASSPSGTTPGTQVLFSAPISLSSLAEAKVESLDPSVTLEDEMEEEATEPTSEISLGAFGGFGLGSTAEPGVPKPNLFGASFPFAVAAATENQASSTLSMAIPSGQLFRPASFSLPTIQPFQPTSPNVFSGNFDVRAGATPPTGSAFGQPVQIGAGQQALGSMLGSFGQSRQLGTAVAGAGFTSSGGFGGGGFVGAATGGGFAGAAAGSGFAAAASSGGGGFATISSSGRFNAFSNQAGSVSSFSAFSGGSATGTGKPPSDLFTQIRR